MHQRIQYYVIMFLILELRNYAFKKKKIVNLSNLESETNPEKSLVNEFPHSKIIRFNQKIEKISKKERKEKEKIIDVENRLKSSTNDI